MENLLIRPKTLIRFGGNRKRLQFFCKKTFVKSEIFGLLQSSRFYASGDSSDKSNSDKTDKLNFVNGKRLAGSATERKFPVTEPSKGLISSHCPSSDENDVDLAVRSAQEAFNSWSALSGFERGNVLNSISTLIRNKSKDIARLEVKYNGKPIYEAQMDVEGCADTFYFYASVAATLTGSFHPGSNSFSCVSRKPYGVCGGIGAWNYPFQTASWKIAPALACGNTFVYKPSPLAPVTAVALAEIVAEAGAPEGTLNVVQGEAETGKLLCLHEDIRKISFTGSLPTGQKVMQLCATRGIKPVTMELGGKGALVVFEDANVNSAVTGAMMANFLSQGQVCSNASRVYVHKKIMREFREKLLERVKKLKIGDPMDLETRVGAVISKDHAEKVLGYIQSARQEGATILHGGERVKVQGCENGNFISPCVVTDVAESMKVAREEIFGAVLLLMEFEEEEEVMRKVNDTQYKLAAGVFTNNLQRGHRVADKLDFGTVWLNSYNMTPVDVPFGGLKWSGFGRENGLAAIESYSQAKSIYVGLEDEMESIF